MSESKKLLIGFGVIGMICVCVMGVIYISAQRMGRQMENISNSEPTSVAKVQEKIAKFDIPDGYKAVGMSVLGYDTINLVPENSYRSTSIIFMQYNGLITNRAQMEEQLRRMGQQQSGIEGASSAVETYEETIRGETVNVTVTDTSFESMAIRQWVTIFEGNEGPTLLMIQGRASEWDDQFVQDFIDSIE
jgi:hypothetical protein